MESYRIINAANAIPPGAMSCIAYNPLHRFVILPCNQGDAQHRDQANALKMRMLDEIMGIYQAEMAAGMSMEQAEEETMEFLVALNKILDAQTMLDLGRLHGDALMDTVKAHSA